MKKYKMKLLIFGPPGSGKGTYASRIASKLEIEHVSMGDLLREFVKKPSELADKVKNYMLTGALVPDELVMQVLQQELASKDKFILDGYPRTKEQAKALAEMAEISAVINLDVPLDVVVARLESRRQCGKCKSIYNLRSMKPKVDGTCDNCGSSLFQRDDDKPEVIKQRFSIYEKETRPALDYFKSNVINIKNTESDIPPEVVVARILEEIKKI